jgi:hypothetical protein
MFSWGQKNIFAKCAAVRHEKLFFELRMRRRPTDARRQRDQQRRREIAELAGLIPSKMTAAESKKAAERYFRRQRAIRRLIARRS